MHIDHQRLSELKYTIYRSNLSDTVFPLFPPFDNFFFLCFVFPLQNSATPPYTQIQELFHVRFIGLCCALKNTKPASLDSINISPPEAVLDVVQSTRGPPPRGDSAEWQLEVLQECENT